jgi:hypothetical protein
LQEVLIIPCLLLLLSMGLTNNLYWLMAGFNLKKMQTD